MIEISQGFGIGTWRAVRDSTSARITCPNCGFDAELDHEIAEDRTVNPSVECPANCGFHEHIRLMGWKVK